MNENLTGNAIQKQKNRQICLGEQKFALKSDRKRPNDGAKLVENAMPNDGAANLCTMKMR